MTLKVRAHANNNDSLWLLVLALLGAAAMWGGYWYWAVYKFPEGNDLEKSYAMRGQFGDMFGAVNALFTALAFAVLIYTMTLQRKELRLQREELADTRFELARTASSQEKSELALCSQVIAMQHFAEASTEQVKAMQRFAEAATQQARAMGTLADATKLQAGYDRDSASAAKEQTRVLEKLAGSVSSIERKIK